MKKILLIYLVFIQACGAASYSSKEDCDEAFNQYPISKISVGISKDQLVERLGEPSKTYGTDDPLISDYRYYVAASHYCGQYQLYVSDKVNSIQEYKQYLNQ